MCLLDEVIDWQADRIHCRSRMRPASAHPLGHDGVLAASALVEYAAQATAAHGSLLVRAASGGGLPAAGRLVGLRDVALIADTGQIAALAHIDIHAERLMADPTGSIYAFRVVGAGQDLVRGRVTIRTVGDDA